MYKVRLSNVILGVALILMVIVALKAFSLAPNAGSVSRSNPGMGDVHIVEGQQSNLEKNKLSYTGMGEWKRFETKQLIRDSSKKESGSSYVGMGDLHLLEGPSSILVTGSGEIVHRYVGMGDVHLFEDLAGEK
ncbi:MAG TPA: hypothetical protein VMT46_18445 [Anaerolineaceae bacterium]|nr:hypothetical protein [Anaerolineaceae bacterium]